MTAWVVTTPYVETEEHDVLCTACAIRLGADQFGVGPSCFKDDDVVSLIADSLWVSAYSRGLDMKNEDGVYEETYQRWHSGDWDEAKEGQFWEWCDKHAFPFLKKSYTMLLEDLKAKTPSEIMGRFLNALIKDAQETKLVSRADAASDILNRLSEA